MPDLGGHPVAPGHWPRPTRGGWRGAIGLGIRLSTRLHRRALDRALAEGADPLDSPHLMLRAAQLTSRRRRERLADGLDAFLAPPGGAYTAALPARRDQVLDALPPMAALLTLLRSPQPVAARGMASLGRLLADGGSPFFSPARRGKLKEELERVISELQEGLVR